MAGFEINTTKLRVQAENKKQIAKNLQKLRIKIDNCNQKIDIDMDIGLNDEKIKKDINFLIDNLDKEIISIKKMSDSLIKVCSIYDDTEKNILIKKKKKTLLEKFYEEIEKTKKEASNTLEAIDKWAKTKQGEIIEELYDTIDWMLGEDSPLGDYKTAYEIMKDIITGEVDIETGKKLLEGVGGVKTKTVVKTLELILNDESFLNRRSEQFEKKQVESFYDAEILSVVYYMIAQGIEVGGKSIFKITGDLAVDALKLDLLNSVIKTITGEDYGEKITDMNNEISGIVSNAIDQGGKGIENFENIYQAILKCKR